MYILLVIIIAIIHGIAGYKLIFDESNRWFI